MFGKPDWFVPKRIGWGLTPVTWQGWVYALVWALVISMPFIALLSTRGVMEALFWMAASLTAICFDVKLILDKMKERQRAEDRTRIMDEKEIRRDELSTQNFTLHVSDQEGP